MKSNWQNSLNSSFKDEMDSPTFWSVLTLSDMRSVCYMLTCCSSRSPLPSCPLHLVAQEARVCGLQPGFPAWFGQSREPIGDWRVERKLSGYPFLQLPPCCIFLPWSEHLSHSSFPQLNINNRQSIPSWVAWTIKNLPARRETWVQSLGWEDPLEKGIATHYSILAWRILWTVGVCGLQSMDTTEWRTHTQIFLFKFAWKALIGFPGG